MKRYLLCFFICILLLFACACEEQEPVLPENDPDLNEASIEFSQPAFYLEALPELVSYTASREIVSRYGKEEFVDTLKPASDYGRLYPYEGKFIGTEWCGRTSRYGLVDTKGRIVVDPVYQEAYYAEPANGEEPEYLVLAYPVDHGDEETQRLVIDSDAYIQPRHFVFASIDGSWISDTFSGEEACLYEDRIIIYDCDSPNDFYSKKRDFRIYDLKGRLITQGNGVFSGFQEGLSAVRHVVLNEQDGSNQIYYDYMDKNGKVVIPGPFTEAEDFVNGFANVVIGEDEHRVIDTEGNIRRRSRPGGIRYDYWGDYICFTEYAENTRCCILAKNGDVIVDNQYSAIWPASEPGSTFMVGMKEYGSYWIIDPQSGEENKIDLPGSYINANIRGNNWCEVTYNRGSKSDKLVRGFVLLKGGLKYQFYDDEDMSCSYLTDDLFALSFDNRFYDRSGEHSRIFDAAIGEVIGNIDGYFEYQLNDVLLVFTVSGGGYQLVFGPGFQPAFSADDLGGGHIINIQYLVDDIYSIRTTIFSGLIKENGQWLIRVYANNTD